MTASTFFVPTRAPTGFAFLSRHKLWPHIPHYLQNLLDRLQLIHEMFL